MSKKVAPVIEHNLTTLLRAGAFNINGTQLQPMSTFKWNKLQSIASKIGVAGTVSYGAKILENDKNISSIIKTSIKEEDYNCSDATMYNFITNKRFLKIQDDELHAMDTSIETLDLLKLLVANANDIITHNMSLNGIIAVGRYLREKGNRVDFVKLNDWIHHLGILQMSSFIASVLIELFDFEPLELEFMKRRYYNPLTHYYNLVRNADSQNCHFKTISRLNLALIETTSYHLGKIKSNIVDIEE